MMIAWPDQWYHTSGDRVDKADPTQLKRTVVIGAAGAYTIANADDDMVIRILGEITANATQRLGHQFMLAQDALNRAEKESLAEAYKKAYHIITCAAEAERTTLSSVLELARSKQRVSSHLSQMQQVVNSVEKAHLAAIGAHMAKIAEKWNVPAVQLKKTNLENTAAKIIPKPTEKVRANGYRGYSEAIESVPEEILKKYPCDRRAIANIGELHRLINGKNSALKIKYNLDVQHPRETDLQNILNYLEILKAAGLVVF
jgi:aminopeptidase YwaD